MRPPGLVLGPPGPLERPLVGREPGARAWPGGGGIGRPLGDSGRPGGGGTGRPVGETGRSERAAGARTSPVARSVRAAGRAASRLGGASTGGRGAPGVGRPLEMTPRSTPRQGPVRTRRTPGRARVRRRVDDFGLGFFDRGCGWRRLGLDRCRGLGGHARLPVGGRGGRRLRLGRCRRLDRGVGRCLDSGLGRDGRFGHLDRLGGAGGRGFGRCDDVGFRDGRDGHLGRRGLDVGGDDGGDLGRGRVVGDRGDRRRLGGGLLGWSLLRRLGLLGLFGPGETIAYGAPAHHVGVRLVERRRVALHGHTEFDGELDRLGIGHAEFLGEFMYSDVLGHASDQPFLRPDSLISSRRCRDDCPSLATPAPTIQSQPAGSASATPDQTLAG